MMFEETGNDTRLNRGANAVLYIQTIRVYRGNSTSCVPTSTGSYDAFTAREASSTRRFLAEEAIRRRDMDDLLRKNKLEMPLLVSKFYLWFLRLECQEQLHEASSLLFVH